MNEDKIRKQLEIYLRDNNKDLKNAIEIIKEKYEDGLLTGRFEIPTAEGSKYIFSYEQGIMCEIKDSDYQSYLIYDEYRKTDNVKFFQRDLRFDGFYEHYPPEFEDLLQTLKNGQVVTFNNGKTYAVAVTKKKLLLKPVYSNENFNKIEIKEFLEKTTLTCDLTRIRESEYKTLYKELTQGKILNASLRYTTKIDMDKKVKELEKKLKKSETHSIFVGNNRFYVRHTLIGPLWYDACGKRIPRKLFTYFLAWVETAPVIIEIHEKDSAKSDVVKKLAFIYDIDSMLGQGEFEKAYDYILENLPDENDFELNIKSLKAEKDDYRIVNFVFKKGNEIDKNEFREFFEEKYMKNHLSIHKIKADKETLEKKENAKQKRVVKVKDERIITRDDISEIDDKLSVLLNDYQNNKGNNAGNYFDVEEL